MVRLNVAEQHSSNSNSNNKTSNTSSSNIQNNNSNAGGSCSSTTSSTTSLNSNSASPACNMVMLQASPPAAVVVAAAPPPPPGPHQHMQQTVATATQPPPQQQQLHQQHQQHQPQQQQLQQQQQQQQHSPSDGGSSNCSLPASPPLLQQTATPPQGAQIVPPVCALHHPQQQLALMAAMQHHQHMLQQPPPPPHALHHAPPPHPPNTQQQPHQPPPQPHENGHGGGGGVSPNGGGGGGGSSASSVSSISSGSGGSQGNGSINGTNGIGPPNVAPPPPAQLPPGQLYIPYPSEFYPEYYIAPHPHEGICPQHPHHPHPHAHHHQPMCAMSAEYGPATVQMVSQSRPPPPMTVPVQVPQYVNENGTVTHVMLSPQQYQQLHPGQGHLHPPPFISANGTSHFYTPAMAGYPPGPAGNGPPHYQMPPPQGAPQQQPPPSVGGGGGPPQPVNAAQQQQQQQPPPAVHTHSPHSPSPPNYRDERSQRQHTKLLRKLEKQRESNPALSTPTHSPSLRGVNDLNGHHTNNNNNNNIPVGVLPLPPHLNNHNHHMNSNNNNNSSSHLHNNNNHVRRLAQQQLQQQQQQQQLQQQQQPQRNGNPNAIPQGPATPLPQRAGSSVGGASSVGTSEDGEDNSSLAGEDEEDYQSTIVEQISAIEKPEVIDVTSRAAKIIWESPVITDALLINMRDLRYQVLLSDSGKQCKYKSLYRGEAYECIVQDLQPGQDYLVRLQVHYQKLQGTVSEPTEFRTPACEPDQPLPPKLVSRTKSSINLRWAAPPANGATIQHYLLEYDEGKGQPLKFVELAKIKAKHYVISKLQPTTVYSFRLAAVNEVGQSLYSSISSYSTAGNPPAAPKPPQLHSSSPSSLKLFWERRTQDGDFLLQLQDAESGHGYLNTYKGTDLHYECLQLRRACSYQFRLRSENEAGVSPWSPEVSYRTAAERPGRPGKPSAKGKIHGTHFKARWDTPADTGGASILRYHLELSSGPVFERIYSGSESEAMCERLQPGTTYQLRACCEGPAGQSPYSDIGHVTTEAVAPAAPPPPYSSDPPSPYAALLKLHQPEYNGGAPILEFEVQMRRLEQVQPPHIVYRGKQAYFVAQDLVPGGMYEVQVRAINRIGAGNWSQWMKFTAAAAAPGVPEELRVLVKSATHLSVSWQAPLQDNGAPVTNYILKSASQEKRSEEQEQEPLREPPSTEFHNCYQGALTCAELRNLAPFTRYFFRILASNAAGSGTASDVVCVSTPAAVPGAPQMQGYEFTAQEVTLNWTQPAAHGSPICSYNIEYGERTIATPDACTRYTVTGLMPETSYKFRVQAVNAIGAGAFSAYAKLTTQPAPPAPPRLECSGAGHNYIKLKWGEGGPGGKTNGAAAAGGADFTKYFVEMYVSRAKQFQAVYSGTNCMCKVHKLQERSSYTFRIYAHTDRAGDGDYSEDYVFETSATLPANIKPPRVVHENSVCLMDLPGQLGMQLTLEWQHSKNSFHDRVEYELQYAVLSAAELETETPKGRSSSSSGSASGAPLNLANQDYRQLYRGPETKFTIDNLAAGTCYQFRVCPVRIASGGELLYGQPSSPLRYQVSNELDPSSATCHHHLHGSTSPNTATHSSQRSSRKLSAGNGSTNGLHLRSVSASAISGSSGVGADPLAIGRLQQELSNFNACGDPLHHHHHHHHHHHQPCGGDGNASSGSSTAGSSCAGSNLLLRGNHMHHQHHLHHSHHMHHAHHPHGGGVVGAITGSSSTAISARLASQGGSLRRFAAKMTSLYSNRKRLSDQQKAVCIVVSFLFVTILAAMLVNMLRG
ncbi:fibronectin type-III domain-containing protein 3A isoform X4 [Drosophila guanche]|uniref:Blast:Fibronectin type-III domain-containing protein 3a n=1 Tax=Drosophila guanche TaxID=7266 RepID=A0A3B0K192_DROGU|nr:fibronectin type-III domain-containing protein 3A isoform X4 [Drosophila guanche]SPP79366.1 blast:Fibronectin type-III domain-containing protein 3a [Drosophila guanche]